MLLLPPAGLPAEDGCGKREEGDINEAGAFVFFGAGGLSWVNTWYINILLHMEILENNDLGVSKHAT